ncbi:unnamed protein product [Rangifer tarandus platyrhynchus]|uniref:Uncharacterized protein n=1 Tax=Rangifer tarandus platyrhynchus TaxID=3082113 RepID=A0ABN8XQ64_RANTA|nr:unnamed protein product [Rangifer tarandus platyrhynchus]
MDGVPRSLGGSERGQQTTCTQPTLLRWKSVLESESRRFRSPEEGVGLGQPLFGRPRTEAPDSKALAHLVSQAGQATYIEPSVPIRALPRGPPGTFPPTERHGPEFEVPGLSGRRDQPLIGFAESDVTTSFPHRLRPSPFPG